MRAQIAGMAWAAVAGVVAVMADDELALTGNVRRNQSLPVALRLEPTAAGTLVDGSLVDGKSYAMARDGRITVLFDEPVVVSRVVLSTYNGSARTYNAGRDVTVRQWAKGRAVGAALVVPIDADAQQHLGSDGRLVLACRAEVRPQASAPVERLTLDVRKKARARQALLREIEVWGLPASAQGLGCVPVDVSVTANTYSSFRVEWPDQGPQVRYVRVRYRRTGSPEWDRVCFTESPGLVLGLRAGVEYEVQVDAVSGFVEGGSQGEERPTSNVQRRTSKEADRSPARAPELGASGSGAPILRTRLPGPLEVRSVGDVFGMNFFPGGGGAHQKRGDEAGMTLRMCELMRDAGVRHVRWWISDPGAVELFAEYGLSLLPNPPQRRPPERLKQCVEEGGVALFSTGNEPDFHDVLAEEYVVELRQVREAVRGFGDRVRLMGPSMGGELVGPGSDYLEACYQAGMKGLLDALDLHPYTKNATPTPPGGHLGGPEGVLYSLGEARKVLERNGEADLPIVVSECGHPTHEGPWFMPGVTPEQQAERLVRTHLLLIASGVRRIWMYAFQDEGTDLRNPEHNFGIVDWHGRPKPGYSAYCAMVRLLSDCRCLGFVPGVRPPVYAVAFRGGGAFRTVLWDCGGKSEVQVSGADTVTGVLDLDGKAVEVSRPENGILRLVASESPLYIRSRGPLGLPESRRLGPPMAPGVDMRLDSSTIAIRPGERRSCVCRLRNEGGEAVEVRLSVPGVWGQGADALVVTVPAAGGRDVELPISAPATCSRKIVSWDIKCEHRPVGSGEVWTSFRRAVFFLVKPAE